jgi:hypothetical protein
VLCAVVLQDLSYLQQDRYAAFMQSWLSAAVPLDAQQLENLEEFCRASQPPDSDTRDLLLVYNDNKHYSHFALKLGPMMWDISHGVSGPEPCLLTVCVWRSFGLQLQWCSQQVPGLGAFLLHNQCSLWELAAACSPQQCLQRTVCMCGRSEQNVS